MKIEVISKRAVAVVLMVLSLNLLYGKDSERDPFEGYWKMKDGNFILDIEKTPDGSYDGHVVWLRNQRFPEGDKDEGKIQVDRNNPDPALRRRPVLGLEIVRGLRGSGDKLEGGWVYDSWHGKMYHGSAEVEDENLLKLRGSMDKFGILGHTMKAYRVKPDEYKRYGLNEA